MKNTGRILHGLTPTARRILFESSSNTDVVAELDHITEVDRAHLVMLAECGIIDRSHACPLLRAIDELRQTDFAPLHGRSAMRGLFILYEDYLIEKLGVRTGGILQTARSRNDLNATVLRLRLRRPYLNLINEALRLEVVLLRRAARYSNVVMPAYTHYQAALPITYGHYLAGIALALSRDIEGLFDARRDLTRCPLGAGAAAGTALPINTSRTALLLGFDQTPQNSIDAVASRDLVLRILANAAILGITLSRIATDFLNWTTSEFGFLYLPDHLVGSSSLMPQKRNPFLLEHIYARGTSAIGAFVAASASMHGAPFTNSIAVGTEAVGNVWKALQSVRETITLTRLVVAGAQPQQETMLKRASDGYTSATELANRLMIEGGVSFRSAHHKIGELVKHAIEAGGEPLQTASRLLIDDETIISVEGLDPVSVAMAANQGGGPGLKAQKECLDGLRATWLAQKAQSLKLNNQWRTAPAILNRAVQQVCEPIAAQESYTDGR